MIWFCGGHDGCLTMNHDEIAEQNQMLVNTTIDELDSVLQTRTVERTHIPKFQFVDQNGQWFKATAIPTDTEFYKTALPSSPTTAPAAGWGSFLCSAARARNPLPGLVGSPWARKRRTRSTSRSTTARSAR